MDSDNRMMSDVKNPQRAEIDALLNGPGLAFELDGETYYIAAPTGVELDDAARLAKLAYHRHLALPEMADLKNQPSTIEQLNDSIGDGDVKIEPLFANMAEELANDAALLVRDRWLANHLLRNADGERMFDPDDPESVEDYQSVRWQRLKDAARPVIWRMLTIVKTVPFGSAPASESD